MIITEIKKFSENIEGKIKFDYNLKNSTWMNIGGKAKVFFVPETLLELKNFLKLYEKRKEKIFVIGAGSNLLISENIDEYVFVKLGKNFNRITLGNGDIIVAGCSSLDTRVSNFACDNCLSGLEFLSCIPGTIGGGIRMNSGCYGKEFKDTLLSVQVIDFNGRVFSINSKDINFSYRQTDLSKSLIFLSATFQCQKKDQQEIIKKIDFLKKKKKDTQPLRVKTSGSTFKNPILQTEKKVWELIKQSVDEEVSFGDAKISNKHSNFFVNSNNATFDEMNELIKFVKNKVKDKTGIKLDLEIEIVN